MRTNDLFALNVLGEHDKATTTGATRRALLARLTAYLRGLPSLDFSDKGRANICARFGLNEAELAAAVAAQQARPGRPTTALLRTIGAAVGYTKKAKGGARPC